MGQEERPVPASLLFFDFFALSGVYDSGGRDGWLRRIPRGIVAEADFVNWIVEGIPSCLPSGLLAAEIHEGADFTLDGSSGKVVESNYRQVRFRPFGLPAIPHEAGWDDIMIGKETQ